MRMLLVTLLLICSLNQFARADDAVRRIELKDCGTIYNCYVPSTCTDLDKYDQLLDMSASTVSEVISSTKIYPHCPAVVRIHQYANYLAHVIIEGLMETTKKIEFFRTGNSQTDTMFCNLTDALTPAVEKLYGAYVIYLKERGKETNPQTKTKKEYMQFDHNSKNIKCEFDIKLSKKYEIFKGEYANSPFQFKINGGSSTLVNDARARVPTLNCDPGKLIHSLDGTEPTKKYDKIQYSPGNFFCADEVFEIEYNKKNVGFTKISKIECELDAGKYKFALTEINPISTKHDDEAEIRCVADVNLFCDEGVKVHEEKGKVNGPLYVKPVRAKNNKKAGTLKCADKTPHLVVKDIDKPIQNATFECTKFGKDQFWTVNRINMPPIRLTKDGPEVYCIDTLDCYLHLRIPESSVRGGDLDESTHLPKCGDKGILHVINGTKKARINPPYCNFATGEYEYNETMSNHIGVVVETTKFECTYPEETREEIRTPTVGKKVGASIGAFLGAIAVGAVIIGGLCAFATRRQKKAMAKQKEKERKEQEYGQKVWKRYCMDENEKELILKNIAKKETEEKTPKALLAGKEVYNWNRMLMHFQRRGFEQTGANRDGVFVPITRPDKHAQAQFDPKTKDPKIAADYYMNDRDVDENNTWDRTTVEKTLIDSIIIDLTECELSEEIEIRLDQREINECPVRVMEIRRRELPEL